MTPTNTSISTMTTDGTREAVTPPPSGNSYFFFFFATFFAAFFFAGISQIPPFGLWN